MKVVLLVGGKGIRLVGEDAPLPKALFRIGRQPIIYHIMKSCAAQGMAEFVLCLGYRGEQIVEYFLHQAPYLDTDLRVELGGEGEMRRVTRLDKLNESWTVTLADTGLESATGERIRRIQRYVSDDDIFIVTYGDGLSDLDLSTLADFHRQHGKTGTVTVVRAHSQFGHISFDEDRTVTNIEEKPLLPGWINGGFFIFSQAIFDYLQPGDNLEDDCLPRLIADKELVARPHEGFWACMDTYKDGVMLNEMWERGEAPWNGGEWVMGNGE